MEIKNVVHYMSKLLRDGIWYASGALGTAQTENVRFQT